MKTYSLKDILDELGLKLSKLKLEFSDTVNKKTIAGRYIKEILHGYFKEVNGLSNMSGVYYQLWDYTVNATPTLPLGFIPVDTHRQSPELPLPFWSRSSPLLVGLACGTAGAVTVLCNCLLW